MKILRAILLSAFLAATFAGGTAWAEESPSIELVRIAQAESGDNRPATLGDIGRMHARFEKRMDRLDNRFDRLEYRIVRLENRMVQMFLFLIAMMIALFGIPKLPDVCNRLRVNGKSMAAAGILLVAFVTASVANAEEVLDYRVLCASDDKISLELQVKSRLSQGWRLHGGVSVAGYEEGSRGNIYIKFEYCQAMVLMLEDAPE